MGANVTVWFQLGLFPAVAARDFCFTPFLPTWSFKYAAGFFLWPGGKCLAECTMITSFSATLALPFNRSLTVLPVPCPAFNNPLAAVLFTPFTPPLMPMPIWLPAALRPIFMFRELVRGHDIFDAPDDDHLNDVI